MEIHYPKNKADLRLRDNFLLRQSAKSNRLITHYATIIDWKLKPGDKAGCHKSSGYALQKKQVQTTGLSTYPIQCQGRVN